ncbi:MAG: ankyrin repeat domain-containing protein [Pirellulales bacterium]
MRSKAHFRTKVAVLAGAVVMLIVPGVAKPDGPQDHVLLSAIRRGDQALLESHLREGAPVNVRTSDGTTPLLLAALYGTPEAVRSLLDHGADPNAVNKNGASALVFAAGDSEKVRLLIDHGADVNARSALGNTPLVAAASHPGNLQVVKLLVDKGADVHSQNSNNVSALAAAVGANDAEAVRFFLDHGCKPAQIRNLFGAAGNSLLEIAAGNGGDDIVELLLAHGADVKAGDANFAGHALNYALLSQKPDVARRLIEAGADITACSPIGKVPPIVLAAYSETGDASIAKLLLERGADPAATSQTGETALTWARRRGFPDVVTLFSGAGTPDPADPRAEVPNRDLEITPDNRESLVRKAVEKSISLLQHSSDVFLTNRRSCVSCHHQNLPGVALGWARDRGFAVDEPSMNRMIARQLDSWSRRVEAAHEMDNPFPVPPQFLGYGLWGLAALGHSANSVTDATVWYLAATQQPDGHWMAGFSRPPMGDGDILSTALAMRALQLYPTSGNHEQMRTRVENAKRWLANSKPNNHQERVFKLLGQAWAGVPLETLQSELEKLLAAQHPDGGWPQLAHLASDAWATGQALVALQIAGRMPSTDPVYQGGIDYLLRTQFDDGSWYVQSRAWPFQPPFDSAFPFGKDQWISAGATAWAMMGLALDIKPTTPSVVPSKSDRPDSFAVLDSPAATTGPVDNSAPDGAQRRTEPVDFVRDIKPVFERSCAGCHSGETPEGGFRVTERELLLRGGESGEAAVLPGRSGQSPLFARASGKDPDLAMPPADKRDKYPALSNDELQAFRAWIDEGASWPPDVSIKPPDVSIKPPSN